MALMKKRTFETVGMMVKTHRKEAKKQMTVEATDWLVLI
jgi:hypothetical protein